MKKMVLLFLIVGAVVPSALFAQTAIDPEKGFTLQNEYAQYVFEPRGMGLSGLVDRRTGVNHIKDTGGKHLLWEVTFGRGVLRPRIDNNYKPCDYIKVIRKPNGDQIAVLQWNNLRVGGGRHRHRPGHRRIAPRGRGGPLEDLRQEPVQLLGLVGGGVSVGHRFPHRGRL